jgi:hypothetical protein
VRFEIEEQDLQSYRRAAEFLNATKVGIVSIQHEFGIFGGPAGSHLLAFLGELRAPVVTTLHTVLREPNADQRRVMQELISRPSRLVVMSARGQMILQDVYQTPPARIDVIPHGIPDVPFVAPHCYKRQFVVGGKKGLLTFGLLSPNKGIHWRGGSLHYSLSGRSPEYVGNTRLCVWGRQGRYLHTVLACRRIVEGPTRCAGTIRRPEGNHTRGERVVAR